MKTTKFILTVLSFITLSILLVGCNDKLKEITYNGSYLEQGQVGEEYEASVATARSEEKVDFEYNLSSKSEKPQGLTLSKDGVLSGTPTEDFSGEIEVEVSAENHKSVSAKFILTIIEADATELTYTGKNLGKGMVGESYSVDLGTATGSDSIKYEAKDDSKLPNGLLVSDRGLLMGTPILEGIFTFIVVASSVGFDNVEAEFTLVIEKSDEPTTFIMEAEYINMENMSGGGYSGSASGTAMIGKDEDNNLSASNGHYVTYTHSDDLEFIFNFKSTIKTDGELNLRLSSDLGDVTFTPESFSIILNDIEVDYSVINILYSGLGSGQVSEFSDFLITKKLPLIEGDNVLKLIVKENDLFPVRGGTMGPVVDCVKITSNSILSWTPLTSNIEK